MDLRPRAMLGYCRKRPRISSSEAINPPISKLVDDLLVEILIRSFPNPKFTCRCKPVCKRWRSLISNPRFNRRFLSHHQKMIDQQPMPANPNDLQSIILRFLPAAMPNPKCVRDNLRVMDCFHDLVLCGFWDLVTDNSEPGRWYLICDLFTKQWVALPLAPMKHEIGYWTPVARLVCEPRISNNHDLGDGQAFVYSEYRFRVVCMYNTRTRLTHCIDVFCSESGEWIKQALGRPDHLRVGTRFVSLCNGELFWRYWDFTDQRNDWNHLSVVGIDPFRLDAPPTHITTSAFAGITGQGNLWILTSSQGALHAISFERKFEHLRPIIWRLEEGRESWRKPCEGLVKGPRCCNYKPKYPFEPFMHPQNSGIIFFRCIV